MDTSKYKKYFIRQYSFSTYTHGGVGYADAEAVFLEEGFQPLAFPYHFQFSLKAKLARLFFLLKLFFSLNGPAIVVFIFPAYAGMTSLLLRWLKWKPDVRIICFIGDIDGLKDGDGRKLEQEIKQLKQYDHFIVHNKGMRKWVIQHIGDRYNAEINFFDFLAKPFEEERIFSGDIVFAGNLGKSLFLEKLGELASPASSVHFFLTGPGCTEKMLSQKNVTWQGIDNPHDLPAKLKGSFGLLWDGDSIDELAGSLGDYMKYISHHKLSLYILSGLPVIVPTVAGTAALVENYNIGITINNLYEIEDKIKRITESEYQQMKKNMQPLAEKISTGGCIREALQKIMLDIQTG